MTHCFLELLDLQLDLILVQLEMLTMFRKYFIISDFLLTRKYLINFYISFVEMTDMLHLQKEQRKRKKKKKMKKI